MDTLSKLIELQKAKGLSNTEVSELLGYKYRTGWARIKYGVRPDNSRFELRALRVFPELSVNAPEKPPVPKRSWLKSILNWIIRSKIKEVKNANQRIE